MPANRDIIDRLRVALRQTEQFKRELEKPRVRILFKSLIKRTILQSYIDFNFERSDNSRFIIIESCNIKEVRLIKRWSN